MIALPCIAPAEVAQATPNDGYFNRVRREIEPLLPRQAKQVLEVGCGAGATLHWLRASGRALHTTGIEIAPRAAEIARTRVDHLLLGPVETQLEGLAPASFDLLLCLDVLEHLVDPWRVLRALREKLKPGAMVIVSLPNVRHHQVLMPLLWRGQWRYQEAGLLDRTHLRFFGRRSARELLQQAGLDIRAERSTGHRPGDGDFWKNLLTLGALSDFFTWQFLLSATRTDPTVGGTQ